MRLFHQTLFLFFIALVFMVSCSQELIPREAMEEPKTGVADTTTAGAEDQPDDTETSDESDTSGGDSGDNSGSDTGDQSGNEDQGTDPEAGLIYFPPNEQETWETLNPESLNVDAAATETLYNYLERHRTRAFLVLYRGRIVLERYFGRNFNDTRNFNRNTQWYWASAGKSLTAFLAGVAQEQGLLDITARTSTYLGDSWSSVPPAKQEMIRVIDHLRMTTGLDESVKDSTPNDRVDDDCTDPECLQYRADAGSRWIYHNAPYNLLDEIIANATGSPYEEFSRARLEFLIGMSGAWRTEETYNKIYWSTARDAARFGLLILNRGNWDGMQLMNDNTYFDAMLSSSQELNPSYGYLWWLNKPGTSSYLYTRYAPETMVTAAGLNGQFINVLPDSGIVVVRMGDAPVNNTDISDFHDEMWRLLSGLIGN